MCDFSVRIISNPAIRVGSHSFNVPYCILVLTLDRVDRLVVKNISHPAVRMEKHSFIMPHFYTVYVHAPTAEGNMPPPVDRLAMKIIISHPAVRVGNRSVIMPHCHIVHVCPHQSEFTINMCPTANCSAISSACKSSVAVSKRQGPNCNEYDITIHLLTPATFSVSVPQRMNPMIAELL